MNRLKFVAISLIALLELMGSIQNDQSNALMTGLILMFLDLMERGKPILAIAFLVLSVYIKLFSLVFFILLLFYPGKIKTAFISLIWFLFFWALPLFVIDADRLIYLYEHWYYLLRQDHGADSGYSVMRILNLWFSLGVNKIVLVLSGLILSLLPLIRFKVFDLEKNRYIYAGMWLIWVVIFNHKSESPLFVIAMTGVALWFMNTKTNSVDTVLLCLAICLTSLAFSDLVPQQVKVYYLYPSGIKAFPCMLIWIKIIFDFFVKSEGREHNKSNLQELK